MVHSYLIIVGLAVLFISSIVHARSVDNNSEGEQKTPADVNHVIGSMGSRNNVAGEEVKSLKNDESLVFDETMVHYESTAEDKNTNDDVDDKHQRLRRSWCDASDCESSTGNCVRWGFYECSGSSIRQCVANNEWRTIANCGIACRYYGRGINRHPYCQ
ncbi:unnamed protein product [Rotaria sp. Silwood2]|nr:unnamed protein product [Rotaria sp. Silwood2]CAF4282747.1 unnamed protein product [Rotaria sp. Silwood2]